VRAVVDQKPAPKAEQEQAVAATALLASAGLLLPLLLDADMAQAAPELLKGRTFSLLHPGATQCDASNTVPFSCCSMLPYICEFAPSDLLGAAAPADAHKLCRGCSHPLQA
jgi:hypothetical protein